MIVLNDTFAGLLERANRLTRALKPLGVRVTSTEFDGDCPTLTVEGLRTDLLPLRGISRIRNCDGYTCTAHLDDCVVRWREPA